jgi:hypothetical protein
MEEKTDDALSTPSFALENLIITNRVEVKSAKYFFKN